MQIAVNDFLPRFVGSNPTLPTQPLPSFIPRENTMKARKKPSLARHRAQDRTWLSRPETPGTGSRTAARREQTSWQTRRLVQSRQKASLLWISNFEGKMSSQDRSLPIQIRKVKTSVWNGRV